MKNDINDIIELLFQVKGIDISIYEDFSLIKALDKRLLITKNGSYNSYLKYLKANKTEIDIFLDSLFITFSEFFRNPLTFCVLEQNVLPSIIENKKTRKAKEIRIWSAACAMGQEAYSLAIICNDLMENTNIKYSCRIFATDISSTELSKANEGVYQIASLNKVSFKRIQKYFTQKGECYVINPELKKYINFSFFDLLSNKGDSPPSSIYGNFDIVFCSNVLFYYKPEYQIRILDKLSKNLSNGGYLVTGEAEREIVRKNDFHEIFINSSVFQKNKH
jgi:chemotaxis protein methyltransferase CheR